MTGRTSRSCGDLDLEYPSVPMQTHAVAARLLDGVGRYAEDPVSMPRRRWGLPVGWWWEGTLFSRPGEDAKRAGKETMSAVSPDSMSEPAAPGAQGGHPDAAEEHVHSPERTAPRPAPQRDQQVLVESGELLRALAAPVRIAIVLQLRVAERCVHELVEALEVTQPLISQHLRVLKSAGVVYGERHGREVVYRLVDDHLAHIVVDAVTHAEELSGTRPHARGTGRRNVGAPNVDESSVTQHTRQETETA